MYSSTFLQKNFLKENTGAGKFSSHNIPVGILHLGKMDFLKHIFL